MSSDFHPDNDEYAFLNSQQPQKKGLFSFLSTNTKKQRMLIAVIGGLTLLVIMAVIAAIALGGGPSNKQELLSIAQQQNELIRVADIGVQKAHDSQAKDLALSAKLTLTTDQQPLLSSLKSQKVKVGKKQLDAGKNPQNDVILTQAAQTNRFDSVFSDTLQSQLVTYQKALKKAYDNPATSKTLKATLAVQYRNASLLINAKPEL